MKAILIDPFTSTISEVEYSGNYTHIYELISTPEHKVSTFDCVYVLDDEDTIYVDDEGLFPDPPLPMFRVGQVRLAGKGLVLGTDSQGNSIEPKITVDQLRKKVSWQPVPGLDLWICEAA